MDCSLARWFDDYVDSAIYPTQEPAEKRKFLTYNVGGVECLVARRRDASSWLIYCHGNSVTLDDLHREGVATSIVAECGCNVIAPAYPTKTTCGESYDNTVVTSLHAVYSCLRADTDAPVYMVGRSLGVAITLRACAMADKVPAGVVCLSGFTSVSDMVPAMLTPVACLVRNRYNNRTAIADQTLSGVSKLIIHGSDDQLVPVAQALQLSEAASNSSLKIIQSMGHNPDEHWPAVFRCISQFINTTNDSGNLNQVYPVWKHPT